MARLRSCNLLFAQLTNYNYIIFSRLIAGSGNGRNA